MEGLQSLIEGKICELLLLCEIGDHSHEPLKQPILDISYFIQEARLKAGREGLPPCLTQDTDPIRQTPAKTPRVSTRLFSLAEKRCPPNYTGLDGPSKKKRAKHIRCKEMSTITTTTTPGKHTVAKDTDILAAGEGSSTNDHSVVPVESCTEECTTGVAHDPAHTEVPQLVARPELSRTELQKVDCLATLPTSEAGPLRNPPLESMGATDTDLSTALVSGVNADIHPSFSTISSIRGSGLAMQEVLSNCVKLTQAFRRYRSEEDMQVWAMGRIQEIQHVTNKIADCDYKLAIVKLITEKWVHANKDMQTRYNESIYWDIILKGAKLLDPATLPPPIGRPDGFTQAEKEANKRFIVALGLGESDGNQRLLRRHWRRLSDMRKAGVDKILLYRTKRFDDFCDEYPKDAEPTLIKAVLSLEQVYGPQIEQLERRVAKVSQGDSSGQVWLREPFVAEKLDVPGPSWDSARNRWLSVSEKGNFESTVGSLKASSDELGGLFDIQTTDRVGRNKSNFVSLLPKDEERLSVVPIIAIRKDDLLGIFAGHIRFSEGFDGTHGIRGRRENLWLDYSKVTGVLNLMRVLKPEENANVRLAWELNGESQREWRVAVRATRDIKPFEEIMRSAHQEAQYLMHQDAACARRGFLK